MKVVLRFPLSSREMIPRENWRRTFFLLVSQRFQMLNGHLQYISLLQLRTTGTLEEKKGKEVKKKQQTIESKWQTHKSLKQAETESLNSLYTMLIKKPVITSRNIPVFECKVGI